MGRTLCEAVAADPDLELVAAVDPDHAGDPGTGGVALSSDLDAITESGATVAIDFTVAPAARQTVPWLAERGVHAVVGTTGFDQDDLAAFRAAFTTSNCLMAANFAIGAVLMMRFAELAAPFFETAEVIELHHDAKRDAPSGTAIATIGRMAAASDRWAPDPTESEVVAGARGGKAAGGIPVHSVRLRGLVAHQEVLFGGVGEMLTIRHDSFDRASFMPGVLEGIRRVGEHPGLTVGLEHYLGLGA
jgi:4-hydroxy-tetrahydrodipicolinate reductase